MRSRMPPLAERLCGWVDDTVAGSRITAYDRDVPAVAAGGTSVPRALNNSPSPTIVGFGFPTQADAIADDTANQRALIWTYGSSTATDLTAYAASLVDANLSGWVFTDADSINNNGEIAGYGMLNGVSHCFALLNYSTPGDANGDGRVDVNDLTIVLTNFGQTGMTWSQGDFNGDRKVDVNDLTILLTNFGSVASSSAAGSGAVPEPSALPILAGVSAGTAGRSRDAQRPSFRGRRTAAGEGRTPSSSSE